MRGNCLVRADCCHGVGDQRGGLSTAEAVGREFGEAVLQAYLAMGTTSNLPDADAQPDQPYHVPPGAFSLASLDEVLRFALPDA